MLHQSFLDSEACLSDVKINAVIAARNTVRHMKTAKRGNFDLGTRRIFDSFSCSL